MKYGDEYPKNHNLSSLRVLGSVGEPINPVAWEWYYEKIGSSQCPIIDTYWQTETGGFVISPAIGIGVAPLKPGSATLPLPGIDPVIMDQDGKELPAGEKGFLVIRKPWPGLMIGLNNDDGKYRSMYFGKFKNMYFTGDYAVKDKDGYYWLLGRADEVLKVSGHRIGTIEIEDALLSTGIVAEAGVFGKPHQVKGESVYDRTLGTTDLFIIPFPGNWVYWFAYRTKDAQRREIMVLRVLVSILHQCTDCCWRRIQYVRLIVRYQFPDLIRGRIVKTAFVEN